MFTHLLGPAKADGSTVWAGQDARPGQGSAPTTTWAPDDLILDEYQLQFPLDMPPGEYAIEAGLYDPAAGGRGRLPPIRPARITLSLVRCMTNTQDAVGVRGKSR